MALALRVTASTDHHRVVRGWAGSLSVLFCCFYLSACSSLPDIEITSENLEDEKESSVLEMFRDRLDSPLSNFSVGSVNRYLWRATLDTLSSMPLASADPFTGVIITDWAERNDNQRIKAVAYIEGAELKSSAIRVQLYLETLKRGQWRRAQADPAAERALEDVILDKARNLRIAAQTQ